MSGRYYNRYMEYVERCEEVGNNILSYEDWKDSEGYRGEYDPDSEEYND